jgi:hypothetical protein
MSEAATIARALGGVRCGSGFLCHCPVVGHGKGRSDRDRSLSVRDGERGVLLKCFAGCASGDVFDVLLRQGLLSGKRGGGRNAVSRDQHQNVFHEPDPEALSIWHESKPAIGTIIERHYLKRVRGVTILPPPSLRFSMQPYQDRIVLPAMIAAVQAPDRRIVAVQRIWVDPRSYRRFARGNVGSLGRGAVRLAAAAETLGLAEGVETALAAMQIHNVPVWATLGMRMHTVAVPDTVSKLLLFADNGQPGHEEADRATDRYVREGREVLSFFPPAGLGDWADVTAAERA